MALGDYINWFSDINLACWGSICQCFQMFCTYLLGSWGYKLRAQFIRKQAIPRQLWLASFIPPKSFGKAGNKAHTPLSHHTRKYKAQLARRDRTWQMFIHLMLCWNSGSDSFCADGETHFSCISIPKDGWAYVSYHEHKAFCRWLRLHVEL